MTFWQNWEIFSQKRKTRGAKFQTFISCFVPLDFVERAESLIFLHHGFFVIFLETWRCKKIFFKPLKRRETSKNYKLFATIRWWTRNKSSTYETFFPFGKSKCQHFELGLRIEPSSFSSRKGVFCNDSDFMKRENSLLSLHDNAKPDSCKVPKLQSQ